LTQKLVIVVNTLLILVVAPITLTQVVGLMTVADDVQARKQISFISLMVLGDLVDDLNKFSTYNSRFCQMVVTIFWE
jgi:biopolymer transport protein ExbB/TolQ